CSWRSTTRVDPARCRRSRCLPTSSADGNAPRSSGEPPACNTRKRSAPSETRTGPPPPDGSHCGRGRMETHGGRTPMTHPFHGARGRLPTADGDVEIVRLGWLVEQG